MREQVELMIGGAIYSLRPTWEAYAEIEARTGKSVKQLWFAFATGEIKLSEMSIILVAGMKAGGDGQINISEQKAMQVIYEAGPWWDQDDGVAPKLLIYLEALGWTPEQRKKVQAEMEKGQSGTISEVSSQAAPQSTD